MSESPKKWSERHGGTLIAVLLISSLVLLLALNIQ
jgi:hypothetical protein